MNYILITGGLGFLGSNLANYFLQDSNNYVIVVDNLVTGKKSNLKNQKNLKVIIKDIIEPDFVDFIIKSFSEIHQIYNLACIASPKKYQEYPLETLDVCYLGTKACLKLSEHYNSKFLQASTSEVYGDSKICPQTISYNGNVSTTGCRGMYDEGKRVAETIISVFKNKSKNPQNFHIARIFNTFGEFMDKNDGRVVSNFINNALENKDLIINGNGSQTRSLIYIIDQIHGLVTLMNSNIFLANVGSEFEIDMKSFAEMILKMIPTSTSGIIYSKQLPDDPMIRRGDYTEMYSLGWKPKINLELGLRKTIEYYRGLL